MRRNTYRISILLFLLIFLTSTSVCSVSGYPQNDNQKYYEVTSGDSLYLIAQRNQTTVEELKRVNGLKSNTIYIGQTLGSVNIIV